jgi:hypothetical protein
VSIAGLLDLFTDVPEMKFSACREYGAAKVFDAALTGEELAVDRALCICRGCPERVGKCAPWAATLGPKELQTLGVVAGQNYTTPPKKAHSGRPQSRPVAPGQPNSPKVAS